MWAFLFAGVALLATGVASWADTLILKNEMAFEGKTVALNELAINAVNRNGNFKAPVGFPFWMLDDQVRRYRFPGSRVKEIIQDDGRKEWFRIPQQTRAQKLAPASIGGFSHIEPFNEFGHGMVQLRTNRGNIDIHLGITELRPDYTRITALEYDWSFGRTTASLEKDVLEKLLYQQIDRNDPEKRMAIIAFYVEAGMSAEARREAEGMLRDFPERKVKCEQLLIQMGELDARRVINEIQRRKSAGQHQLAYHYAKLLLNEQLSADISRQVRELIADYDATLERRDHILMRLDVLQAALPPEQMEQVRPLRNLLTAELHYETLSRLKPFELVEADETLSAAAKLGLAYSGWVVGEPDAVEELPLAVRMWEMRFLVTEALRDPDPQSRASRIKSLEEMEGFSVERIARMVPLLPIQGEPTPAPAGVATTITVPTTGAVEQIEYVRILPPEYNAHHTYPLLVVLHDAGKDAETELKWWAGDAEKPGQAQRRGFITIAPRYTKPNCSAYEYDALAHQVVVESVRHSMKTHLVDADRVVLTGHGMGGDACFDMGMSHPDLFAGVAPFCGMSTKYCMYYWANGLSMPWYVVAGERDGVKEAENMRDLNKLFRKRVPIIYCQFKERGFEGYAEEQSRVLDWAEIVRRPPLAETKEFEFKTLRTSDDGCHWVRSGSLDAKDFPPVVWELTKKHREMLIAGHVTPGKTIIVQHPGRTVSIWLNPDLVNDFEERIRIKVNGRERMNDFVKPSAQALLEDLRTRGDRSRLFWARVDL